MATDPAFDLLAHVDRLGEPSLEAMATDTSTGRTSDGPMSPEQADHLNHLMRRAGRNATEPPATFAEAKARITELLHDLG